MHTLVVSRIFTLWMFAESVVDGALTISYSGSNVIGSTTYSLKCEVPGFSGQAVWNIGGTTSITCLTSVCIPASSTPYTFRQNGTAIYADFSVLAATEDDIQWSCQHATDTTVFFKVEVDFGVATTETSIEGSPSSENKDYGPAIGGGVAGGCIVIIIILYLIWRNWPRGPRSPPRDPPTQPTYERSTQEAVIGKPVVLLPNLSKSYHSVQYKSVQWTHNDKPVSTDKDNAYKGGKKSSPSLEISSVSEEDFGLWKCILESENSKQVFVVQLTKGSIHSTLDDLPPIMK